MKSGDRADARIRTLVWDTPTRVFHWLLALSFAGAYIVSDWDDWRIVHVTLGYTLGGLLLFRLIWGFVGTRHARFSDFRYGPRDALAYLLGLRSGAPRHYAGHNPAGSWAIYAILVLGACLALSGFALYNELGGEEVFEEVHEFLANALLGVVAIHLIGVVASSIAHRENLARSMVTGYKLAAPDQAIASSRVLAGVVLGAAVLAFWINAFGIREALVGTPPAHEEAGEPRADD